MAKKRLTSGKEAGVQRAIDRFVESIRNLATGSTTGTNIVFGNHVKVRGDASKLAENIGSPLAKAVRINVNASPSKFRFIMGRDVFSDDVVL